MVCWKDQAKRQFDGWSSSYDASVLQRWFFNPSHEMLLAACHVAPGGRVLDVGCGTGLFVRKLLKSHRGVHCVGLDLSEQMLDRARANCRDFSDRLVLVQGDSEHLPFDDSSFDVVTCIHSFHHYPHQTNVLREMHRVLHPGGQLLIIDGDRDGWWGWLLYDWVVTTLEGTVHHCSARELREVMRFCGLSGVEQSRCGWLIPLLLSHATAHKAPALARQAA